MGDRPHGIRSVLRYQTDSTSLARMARELLHDFPQLPEQKAHLLLHHQVNLLPIKVCIQVSSVYYDAQTLTDAPDLAFDDFLREREFTANLIEAMHTI